MSGCELFALCNSKFCASGKCPDEGWIPTECADKCFTARTVYGDASLGHCETDLSMHCPCARPADPRRWAAYERWKVKFDVREELWQMRHALYARRRVTLEW